MDADTVTAIATVVQALAGAAIAFLVYRFTEKSSRVDNHVSINDAWQTFNLMVLQSTPKQRDLLRQFWEEDEDDEETVKKFMAFMLLNILSTVDYAKRHRLVKGRFAKQMLDEQIKRLNKDHEFIEKILNSNRGYEDGFRDFVLNKMANERNRAGTQQSNARPE